MTTFIARHGAPTTAPGAALRARAQQFGRSLVAVGAVALHAIEASRSVGSSHTAADRRAVLDRFAADLARDAGRTN